jgi:hypothetical protein
MVSALGLRCPAASYFLRRSWLDFAFRQTWDYKLWSWQRKRGQFIMNQAYTDCLVNVTQGNFTVEGVGTTFTSDMVSRQFRTGLNSPIYTIGEFADATHIDLTEAWGIATNTLQPYSIYNAYVTVPSDFQNFISVIDTLMNWQLTLNVTQEELNAWDAQRATTGTAYNVSMFDYDGEFNDPPLPRYEIWPHQRSSYCYPFLYISRPPDLSDPGASLPRYIRGDVLIEMALAQAARWPGASKDSPNPYFSLPLAMQHDVRGLDMLRDMARTDDEICENDVSYMSMSAMPFATVPWGDSRFLQSHDI